MSVCVNEGKSSAPLTVKCTSPITHNLFTVASCDFLCTVGIWCPRRLLTALPPFTSPQETRDLVARTVSDAQGPKGYPRSSVLRAFPVNGAPRGFRECVTCPCVTKPTTTGRTATARGPTSDWLPLVLVAGQRSTLCNKIWTVYLTQVETSVDVFSSLL